MFQLEFYETEDGKQPVSDFLDSLNGKMAAKLVGLMDVLEEKGTELREPYSKFLGDGIFELRCKFGRNITRALYFFLCRKENSGYKRFCEKDSKNTAARNYNSEESAG